MTSCKITGYFWNVVVDYENKKTSVVNKRTFFDKIVELDLTFDKDIFANENVNKIIKTCIKITSKNFLKWLKTQNILNFFPVRSVTIDYDNNIDTHNISICYYQDDVMYNRVYGQMETTGYVMQPNIIIFNDLEQFYDSYQINCDPGFILLGVYE